MITSFRHFRLPVLIGLLFGCEGFQNYRHGDPPAAGPEILFLVLTSVRADAGQNGGPDIRIIEQKRLPGQLKKQLPRGNKSERGYLICSFLDGSKKVLGTQLIEDPLSASVEYPGDNHTMNRITLPKGAADFVLRVQYDPAMTYLQIEQSGPAKNAPPALLHL